MKLISISALSILCISSAFAGSESSTGTRGGGDPAALEFCSNSKSAASQLRLFGLIENKEQLQNVDQLAKELCLGLDNPSTATIRFTNENLRDPHGVEKIAIYNVSPLTVTVNRFGWLNLNKADKVVVASLELMGLAQVNTRYTIAGRLQSLLKDDQMLMLEHGTVLSFKQVFMHGVLSEYFLPVVNRLDDARIIVIPRTDSAGSAVFGEMLCRTFGNKKLEKLTTKAINKPAQALVTVNFATMKFANIDSCDKCETIQRIVCAR